MSYCIQQRDQDFLIKAAKPPRAYEALSKRTKYVEKHPEQTIMQRFTALMGYNDYSVDYDKTTGDCIGVWLEADRLGNDMEMFDALAPYVEHGSYVEFIGEDNYIWRWVFKQGELHEVSAKIVWEDDIL